MKKYFFISFLLLTSKLIAQHNVILIIADDLGTDYCGFYADHKDTVDLPTLRALANRGIIFSNAMSNPVCSSTRSGILTGRYSFRTGVGNIVGGTGGSGTLDTSEFTLPKSLKKFNPAISTANIGKWHLHNPTPVANLLNPNKMGYDHFEGPFIGALPSYTSWTKYTNGVASTITNYATTENVNNAITWVKQQNNKPFFLWLAFNAPHAPYHLPPNNLHSYNLSGTQQDINQNPKKYFKAMLQALDTEMGRLIDSLKAIGRYENTDFIFIGDNGNTMQTAQISNTDKAKGTIYQYGVHVPFIMAGPTITNPGRSSEALINTADIFATVNDLFDNINWMNNLPVNKPVDSKSILPILKNKSNEVRPWAFCEIFKNTTDSADGKALRNMDYKLIRFDYGKEEFYDLKNDPDENNPLVYTKLNQTEINNYVNLCNQLSTLVGKGAFCIENINQKPYEKNKISINPNPFQNFIKVTGVEAIKNYKLFTPLGQLVYSGNNIEQQDFSWLPNGLYFLQPFGNTAIKLIKN